MDKQEQKKLLSEIMQADEKNGLYEDVSKKETTQTAVEWLVANLPERFKNAIINTCTKEIEESKKIEQVQIMDAYIAGYKNAWADANSHVQEYVNTVIK